MRCAVANSKLWVCIIGSVSVFFAAVIVRTTAQADSRVQRITYPAEVCRRLADYSSWGFNSVFKEKSERAY